MKISKMISRTFVLLSAAVILSVQPVRAESERMTGRDLSADNMLIKNAGWTGALPPTGGESVAAGAAGQTNFVNPAFPGSSLLPELSTKDRSDKRAQVYGVQGEVKAADKAGSSWKKVKKGMKVKEGTVLLTGKASSVSITFDALYANVIFIPENTRAVFRKIEPTDIFLEDGTIYNFFDAVPGDGSWKVSSPVAVAAVRGTHYLVNFTTASGDILAATFSVPNDGKDSKINLIRLENGKEGKSVDVPEGRQINLKAGIEPDPSMLEDIDPLWIKRIQAFLEELTDLRLRRKKNPLPPTGGEFFEPGVMNTAGADAVGGSPDDNRLDPGLDTHSVQNEPEPSSSSDTVSPPDYTPPPQEGGGEAPPPNNECPHGECG